MMNRKIAKNVLLASVLLLTPAAVHAGEFESGGEFSAGDVGAYGSETELKRGRHTDAGVKRVFQVQQGHGLWYEAEDAAGNRYTVTGVVGGVASGHGVVDFGDGQGGRYVAWN